MIFAGEKCIFLKTFRCLHSSTSKIFNFLHMTFLESLYSDNRWQRNVEWDVKSMLLITHTHFGPRIKTLCYSMRFVTWDHAVNMNSRSPKRSVTDLNFIIKRTQRDREKADKIDVCKSICRLGMLLCCLSEIIRSYKHLPVRC